MNLMRIPAGVSVLLAVFLSCDRAPAPPLTPDPLFVLEDVRDTGDGAPVLLSDGSICLPDRYQRVVLCRRAGEAGWHAVGREGEGPGELKMPGFLARYSGAAPAIVVLDLELRRLSVFDVRGEFLGSTLAPYPFIPLHGDGTGHVVGVTPGVPAAEGPFTARIVTLSIAGNTRPDTLTIEARRSPGRSVELGLGRGVSFPDGEMIFHVSGHRFARYSPDGRLLGEFEYPAFLQEPVYPGDRELAVYRRDMERLQGAPVSEEQLERRRRRPIGPLMGGLQSIRAGADSLLLVGAARARDTISYIDVFDRNGRYRTAVAVPGRLRGFDVLGDTLLVLVDRAPESSPAPALELRGYTMPDAD
jgi:hypothetical protein